LILSNYRTYCWFLARLKIKLISYFVAQKIIKLGPRQIIEPETILINFLNLFKDEV